VSTAPVFISASVPRDLRELRSADRRSRGTGADARFLWRVTMTARPVDQEDQLHQQQPREAGAATFLDVPGLTE